MTRVFLSTKTAAGGGGSDAKERDWINELRDWHDGKTSEPPLEQRRALDDRDPRSLVTCLDMVIASSGFSIRSNK